jgi:phospholipid transport system transporter-binding protein
MLRVDGDALVLEGAVTMRTAPDLSASLDAQLAKSKPRRIDLSGVTELDSTALALVLQIARSVGSALPIVGAPPGFTKLAALYGVDTLLASS